LKCGKQGHWAAVCRSAVAAINNLETEDDENMIASILCATDKNKVLTKGIYQLVMIGEEEREVKALIDPGSTNSFISMKICKLYRLPFRPVKSKSRLANGDTFNVAGVSDTILSMKDRFYTVKFSVVDALICDVLIGLDVLSQHQSVSLSLGGSAEPIEISNVASIMKCDSSIFPVMKVEPPMIFNEEVYDAKPVITKSRWTSNKDREFMQNEITRMLKEGIIEPSNSCWRSQAFVVHKPKDRMVIDYSETVNRFTKLDAYPFPDMEDLLNKATEYRIFSKLDLKSAYHQIPLSE